MIGVKLEYPYKIAVYIVKSPCINIANTLCFSENFFPIPSPFLSFCFPFPCFFVFSANEALLRGKKLFRQKVKKEYGGIKEALDMQRRW